jgi:hypothetical protein
MTDLEMLIQTADNLCSNLEKASMNEKAFNDKVTMELERFSWDMYRMANDLKKIQEYIL